MNSYQIIYLQDPNVDPMNMMDPKNNNIYIIAVVAKTLEGDDVKFYLIIKSQIMNVSLNLTNIFLSFKFFFDAANFDGCFVIDLWCLLSE